MLVLTRKTDQSIMIGDAIEIKVCRVSGGKVVLGLKAPAEVRILRGELHRQQGDESKSAIDVPPDHTVEAGAR